MKLGLPIQNPSTNKQCNTEISIASVTYISIGETWRIFEKHQEFEEQSETLAGQAGNPLTLARTRSPKLKCPLALALFAPRRRAGPITVVDATQWLELKKRRRGRITEAETSNQKTLEKSRGSSAAGMCGGDYLRRRRDVTGCSYGSGGRGGKGGVSIDKRKGSESGDCRERLKAVAGGK